MAKPSHNAQAQAEQAFEQGWSLVRCAELGNRIGALKVAVQGPQTYTVDARMLATWLA